MILFNPIWLFALAALSIPVAIHLWNIRQGKTLKVGSISLITVSSQKRSRSLKLHDLLLLLLRCLLLALLALVLTMPFWQRNINPSSIKGWVMIPKENLKESYQKFKPEIDSLTKAGYEFHYFDKDFQKAVLNDVLADSKNLKADSVKSASYWSLVQQLDGQIPSSLPLYLFTPNGISYFNGEKPKVGLNLHWQTYGPADSTNTWLAQAWLMGNSDIQVVEGNSKPGGSFYSYYTLGPGAHNNREYVYSVNSGRLVVSRKNSDEVINVDTSTWHFAIYAEKNTADAGYVKAALQSIVQFTKHKAVIKEYTDAGQIPSHQNWLFWLSSKPVSKQVSQNCDNLFSYEAGKVKDINTWISNQDRSLSNQKIALYKSVATNNNWNAIWHDGFDNPVLSFEKQDRTNLYHFYSRFDPSWNDLVWSDDFPKMLLGLIVGQPVKPDVMHDRRAIDPKQLLPAANNEARTSTGKIIERTDLAFYCWLLLVLIFIVERWIAHKKAGKQELQNG